MLNKQFSVLVAFIVGMAVAHAQSPSVRIEVSPSRDKFYIGETNTVTNSVRFPAKLYKGVKIVLYPTVDVPDVVITKVTRVTVGRKLAITGKAKPVMDWGIKHFQVPGRALSCEIDFGDIFKIGNQAAPGDDSITITYEAAVLGQVPEFTEVGHRHELGVSVTSQGTGNVISFATAEFAYRSLPLLFRAQGHNYKSQQPNVVQMAANSVNNVNNVHDDDRDLEQTVYAY